MPYIGTAIAVATVVATVRRKGLVGGSLDTGLNAMPIVGAVKNALEVMRGRDFFPDRAARQREIPRASHPAQADGGSAGSRFRTAR